MKSILKHAILDSIALYFTSIILSGVIISGTLLTYIIAGFILAGLFKFCKPIINILSLPLNLATLGLFSFFINTILLYVLTVLMPNIKIVPFTFSGFEFGGFIAPVMHFGTFSAYIVAAAVLSIIIAFFEWLTD